MAVPWWRGTMQLGTKPSQKNKKGERRGNRRAFVKINCNKEKGTPIPLGFFNLLSSIYSHVPWQQGTALLQEAGNGNWEFSIFGFKRHGTCCVPQSVWIEPWPWPVPDVAQFILSRKETGLWDVTWLEKCTGLCCAWERGWGDNVPVPTLPGPVLAEQGDEVSSVTITLHLQDFQFLRGLKAPRSLRRCAVWNHAVPPKNLRAQIIHRISSRGRWARAGKSLCAAQGGHLCHFQWCLLPKYPIPICFPPK